MTEQTSFGTPTRSVVQDANEGVVYPKGIEETERNQNLKSTREGGGSLDPAIQNASNNLGMALAEFAQETVNDVKTKAVVAAMGRQGRDRAINTIDADNKRAPWVAAFAGEDARYRTAQQMAVKNTVREEELRGMTHMSERAGDSPEMYQQSLEDNLSTMLENYEDDPETRGLVMQSWAESTMRLTEKHYKEHYAYTQTEMYDAKVQENRQMFDLWSERASSSTPGNQQDEQALNQMADVLFSTQSNPLNPDGSLRDDLGHEMTEQGLRNAKTTALNENIAAGNTRLLRLAQSKGFVASLNAKEKIDYDQAVAKHDNKENMRTGETVDNYHMYMEDLEHANAASSEPDTIEELKLKADVAYDEAFNSIEAVRANGSGTDRAEANATGRLEQLRRMRGSSSTQLSKADKAARKQAAAMNSARARNTEDQNLADAEVITLGLSNKELRVGYDRHVIDMMKDSQPKLKDTEITSGQAANYLMTNPDFMQKTVAHFSVHDQVPQTLHVVAENTIAALAVKDSLLYDKETGAHTEVGKSAIASLKVLQDNPKVWNAVTSEDERIKARAILRTLDASSGNASLEQIQKNLDDLESKPVPIIRDGKGKPLSPRKFLARRLKSIGHNSEVAVNSYIEGFENELKLTGSSEAAWDAVERETQGDTTYFRGFNETVLIKGTKDLDAQLTEMTGESVSLQKWLVGASNQKVPALQAHLLRMVGTVVKTDRRGRKSNKAPTLGDIEGLSIKVDPMGNGIIMSSPRGVQPVLVSMEEMGAIWSATAQQAKIDQAAKNVERDKTLSRLKTL